MFWVRGRDRIVSTLVGSGQCAEAPRVAAEQTQDAKELDKMAL